MARKYLVTGGAGFIGSNFIRYVMQNEPDALITNVDSLTYAGVESTISELNESPNHYFVKGDIRDVELVGSLTPDQDVVVHFAAESHVDRSIQDPTLFLSTNVVGTGVLLNSAMEHGVRRFIHVSTDEVYGSIAHGFAAESDPLRPSSPYSSSKAGSDLLALSYNATYGYDVVVTRCTNNYGPYQFPEKMIPLFLTNLLQGRKVPLYGHGKNERDWLFVEDHCAAIHLLVSQGEAGEIYNIGAGEQLPNLELTRTMLEAMGKDDSWIEFVPDRPGHDLRYAVDSSKIRGLGWAPRNSFEDRLQDTIGWYSDRRDWWEHLVKGTF